MRITQRAGRFDALLAHHENAGAQESQAERERYGRRSDPAPAPARGTPSPSTARPSDFATRRRVR